MAEKRLFATSKGLVSSEDFRLSLSEVGADDCRVLYVHTGLTFGRPAEGTTRDDLLNTMIEVLLSMNVDTVCLPTFTFSFCNGNDFDVRNSRSKMGLLNEFFRTLPDVTRSRDPLMSVAVRGRDLDLAEDIGTESVGENSTFDILTRKSDVKFLFLGVHPGQCFTYMHYLEWLAKVPYRYNRKFSGLLIQDGFSQNVTQELYVRYNGVAASDASFDYGDLLLERGVLNKASLGDGFIRAVGLENAAAIYMELLQKDPNHFIVEPFDRSKVNDDFLVTNMVAL
jgi:aminoglycoside 3-N-acetyltransferase